MATMEQKSIGTGDARACKLCGANEWRRQTRTFWDRLVGLQSYQCGKCTRRRKRWRSVYFSVFRLVLVLGIGAAGFLLWRGAPSLPFRVKDQAASGSEAEALARMRSSVGGQLSAFEQMMAKKPKGTLDNATVLQLWKANVGTNIILQMIRTSNADYDLSAGAIIQLRQSQVDQSIILAMIDSSYTAR